ncbi:MAG: hypothetical protein ACJARX_000786 [Psychroserpens sp.]|jgi:hypothetical protein
MLKKVVYLHAEILGQFRKHLVLKKTSFYDKKSKKLSHYTNSNLCLA